MYQLSVDKIEFEQGSVVDPVGRVFHFDGRIFRAISAPYVEHVKYTIELANKKKWFEVGLISTWLTSYTLPDYPLVIEHKKVPFVSVRGEWTVEGLRDAAICLLNVHAELSRSGLCLKDAHPWNILFDGTQPYFIDWGSIVPARELNWQFWYEQFRQFLLAPLYAFSIGEHLIARAMLREHKFGVGNEILKLPSFRNLPDAPRQISELVSGSAPSAATFEALVNYVASLDIPRINGEWVDYAQPRLETHNDHSSLREKDRVVHRILEQDVGKTLIDIGTNNGLHSEIAASLGKQVLACDIEETCLNTLYGRIRKSRSSILPLYHDFLYPIGTTGTLNTIRGAEERLSCDTALVMAVTHHLAFKHQLSFDAMARGIANLARRRAIVEFVPAEDEHVARWSPESLPWYNAENFILAMRRFFKTHITLASDPYPRCIFIFDKF